MSKKMIWLLAIVVAIVLILVVVLLNLNQLVKTGVEKGGTMVLGVNTTLGSASVSILGGSAALDGLKLGSLEGFKAKQMFSLDHAGTKVEIGSLFGDEIRVHDVVIDGPEITLEFGKGGTNWGTLLDKLKGEPAKEEKEKEKEKPGKRIAIDRISLTNAKIRLAGLLGGEGISVPLPTLEIKDLKTGDGKGMEPREALAKAISDLLKSMLDAVKAALSSEQLKGVADQLGPVLDESMKSFDKTGKAVKEALQPEVEKGKQFFEGILGGKKKQK